MKIILLVMVFLTLSFAKVAVLHVEGMTCPLCTMAVKKSLKAIDGVEHVKVRLNTKTATLNFSDKVSKEQLLKAIKEVGYTGTIQDIK